MRAGFIMIGIAIAIALFGWFNVASVIAGFFMFKFVDEFIFSD